MEYCIIPNFYVWRAFRLSPKHIKSIILNPNISKYWEFGELKVLGYGTKSDMTSKYGTIFFYYYTSLQMRKLWNWRRSIGCRRSQDFPRRNTFQQLWQIYLLIYISWYVPTPPGAPITIWEQSQTFLTKIGPSSVPSHNLLWQTLYIIQIN